MMESITTSITTNDILTYTIPDGSWIKQGCCIDLDNENMPIDIKYNGKYYSVDEFVNYLIDKKLKELEQSWNQCQFY